MTFSASDEFAGTYDVLSVHDGTLWPTATAENDTLECDGGTFGGNTGAVRDPDTFSDLCGVSTANTVSGDTDYYSEINFLYSTGSFQYSGACVRHNGSAYASCNAYIGIIRTDNGDWWLRKVASGTPSNLASGSGLTITASTIYTLRVTVTGGATPTIAMLLNGGIYTDHSLTSTADSTSPITAAGNPGVFGVGGDNVITYWTAQDVAAGGGNTSPILLRQGGLKTLLVR